MLFPSGPGVIIQRLTLFSGMKEANSNTPPSGFDENGSWTITRQAPGTLRRIFPGNSQSWFQSSPLHSSFPFGGKIHFMPKVFMSQHSKVTIADNRTKLLTKRGACICQREGVLSDTLTTFSSQSAGICQNVRYLINMYNASSHSLC